MELLLSIMVMILRALLPALLPGTSATSPSSVADGARQPALRERLHEIVRRHGWVILVICLAGCWTRTIYVPAGEPVRLRETVRAAKVWVLDENGKPVAGRMDLPEGWYCLPIDEENE